MVALLKNFGLFFVVFLPTVALIGMVWEGIVGAPSPTWHVGWNPLMWLVWTAPWHLPLFVMAPLLHFLGWAVAKNGTRSRARLVLLVAAPVLAMIGMPLVYGLDNANAGVLLPVALAGLAYGAALRIPDASGRPASPRGAGASAGPSDLPGGVSELS